jgi:hypothetical protein
VTAVSAGKSYHLVSADLADAILEDNFELRNREDARVLRDELAARLEHAIQTWLFRYRKPEP